METGKYSTLEFLSGRTLFEQGGFEQGIVTTIGFQEDYIYVYKKVN